MIDLALLSTAACSISEVTCDTLVCVLTRKFVYVFVVAWWTLC